MGVFDGLSEWKLPDGGADAMGMSDEMTYGPTHAMNTSKSRLKSSSVNLCASGVMIQARVRVMIQTRKFRRMQCKSLENNFIHMHH